MTFFVESSHVKVKYDTCSLLSFAIQEKYQVTSLAVFQE